MKLELEFLKEKSSIVRRPTKKTDDNEAAAPKNLLHEKQQETLKVALNEHYEEQILLERQRMLSELAKKDEQLVLFNDRMEAMKNKMSGKDKALEEYKQLVEEEKEKFDQLFEEKKHQGQTVQALTERVASLERELSVAEKKLERLKGHQIKVSSYRVLSLSRCFCIQ